MRKALVKGSELEDVAIASPLDVLPEAPAVEPRKSESNVGLRRTFAAFRHHNYRLFFLGQLVSVIGTWMQTVAIGWLVYDLSNSALVLGLILFLGGVPVTLFTLWGGALADRIDKRRVVITTELAAMFLALVLAALVYFDLIQIWHVALIVFLDGITNAFDIPTRQSFVVEMVGKEDLTNAIALNSSLFNGARVFGPALAGMLIGVIGIAGCFFLNSLSYLAVVSAYLAMRMPRAPEPRPLKPMWHETVEALQYVWSHRILRAVMILVAIVSLFGWPYSVLLPVFARDILHANVGQYGFLVAANGVGALLGALALASLGDSPHKRRLVYWSLVGFCVMLGLFALSKVYWISAAVLGGAGFFMILFFATANSVVQMRVPDELRGRVMGIYSLAFLGLTPFGSLLAGALARSTSAAFTVLLGSGICVAAGLAAMWIMRAGRKA